MIVASRDQRFVELPGRRSADPFGAIDSPGLSMRVVQVAGRGSRSAHRHPHSFEAIYAVSGKGTLWEDGTPRRFEAGDCALIAPGVVHATLPEEGTTMELVCFFPHPDLAANIEELDEMVGPGRGDAA